MKQARRRLVPMVTTLLGIAAGCWVWVIGIGGGSPAAAQGDGGTGVPATGLVVSEAQGLAAAEQALRYVEATYTVDGEMRQGVPFRLGGKVTVDEFTQAVAQDPAAAQRLGVDASGLAVNAYRAAIPGLRFFTGPAPQGGTATVVNSSTLHRWNSQEVTPEAARPGDLLFFGSPATGEVSGVGIITARRGAVIRVAVASARQQRVVDTGIVVNGPYWQSNVVGIGRLVYAGAPSS